MKRICAGGEYSKAEHNLTLDLTIFRSLINHAQSSWARAIFTEVPPPSKNFYSGTVMSEWQPLVFPPSRTCLWCVYSPVFSELASALRAGEAPRHRGACILVFVSMTKNAGILLQLEILCKFLWMAAGQCDLCCSKFILVTYIICSWVLVSVSQSVLQLAIRASRQTSSPLHCLLLGSVFISKGLFPYSSV